jgi:hypothetical protein
MHYHRAATARTRTRSTTRTRAVVHASIPKHGNSDDSSKDNDSDNTVLEIKHDGLRNDSARIEVDALLI